MDCERIAAESPPGGPATWELSERAIRGYSQRLLAHGFRPTLFLTPECAAQHADLLTSLAGQGVELGMHCHPQSLADHRYGRYLGEYDAATQREILALATEMLTEAIGTRPVSFRPGNFSANDATYGVLYDLGFQQGSVSDPGRFCPQYAAIWVGAYPDPHYVNPTNKLVVGDLLFLEVPLTTDPEHRRPNGFPYELRIEQGPFETWQKPILEKALRRLEGEQVGFPALCIFTHNVFPYDQPDDPRTITVQEMLDYLANLGRREEILPSTLQEIHTHYRAYLRRR